MRPFLERYPGRGGRFPPVPGRGAAAARRRARRHARRQHAGRRDVRPADAVRQGLLSRQARRRRDDRLAARHLRPPRPDAAIARARRVTSRSGSSAACPGRTSPRSSSGKGSTARGSPRIWLPHGYGLIYPHAQGPGRRSDAFDEGALQRPDAEQPRAATGSACRAPTSPSRRSTSSRMSRSSTATPSAPFTIKMAVPADFEAAIARRTDRPVFKGELNPIFQGIYSSRIELKAWMRIDGAAVAHGREAERHRRPGWARPPIRAAILAAWEPVLFNQTHDLASGVMTDHVYDDTIRSYEYSRTPGRAIIDAKWDVLASQDRHPRAGDAGRRLQPAGLDALGHRRGRGRLRRRGRHRRRADRTPMARPCPSQILESTRYADGGLKTARVAFVARDVPALGYATYHAAPVVAATGAVATTANRPPRPSTSSRTTCIA